ncbi:hypothetical protein C8F04DRAFT_1268813 [Mycena alexandri]|uniref:Uncharacterized protein n=1 Tax=Mycena alexandri TaxID=1745969 RepID=A0AAD6SDW6_9AGAR|nr:hypothetical protein C8F04DRAFT_1268813 [Mycena alexandri]
MSTEAATSADTLLGSSTTLRRTSPEVPRKSRLNSSSNLGLLSLALHSALIALHLTLIGIWAGSVEHRLVFSLDHQKTVSFLITAIATTFGTIYSALLVFATQTLWMRRSLQVDQTLTAIHDHAAAWTGIGSAMLRIWHQKTVAASLTGSLAVFLYLGNILVLHISTPALFSLQTFNLTRPLLVKTQGLPSYNFSSTDNETAETYSGLFGFVSGSLYYLPSVLGNTRNLGLNGSTLYDVLDLNSSSGNVTVHATGFNITCRYLESSPNSLSHVPGSTEWSDDSGQFFVSSTQPGVITVPSIEDININITFYSTTSIIDSQNNHPPEVNLSPPMNNTILPVSSLQLFQCSQSLVNQTAVVDAQSRMLLSVEPQIYKKTSTWLPTNSSITIPNTTTGNLFIDWWAAWYKSSPPSALPRDGDPEGVNFVSVADMYIIQKLNLHPANISDAPRTVMLHDLENTMGEIVAGMFWTLGNILPTSGPLLRNISNDPWTPTQIGASMTPPTFLRGNAIATEIQTRVRLDLSIIAIATGLAASIVLALLSLPSVILNKTVGQKEIPINGTGMLHAIWLYRNNPKLDMELEQVEHPTERNLRQAGMVRVKWAEGGLRRRKSCESF